MKKPKKPPVKAKGGKGPAGGVRGTGAGKSRGLKVHKRGIVPHHPVHHKAPAAHHHPQHPHKPAKTAKAAKPRKWSPGSDVACCSAEALGWLLGWDADEILALYWLTAADPDEGATIEDTFAAASGLRRDAPATWAPGHPAWAIQRHARRPAVPLILGVSLPEPHAIAVTPDGTWWSWGEPFDPDDWPDLVIDETWAVLL